MARTTIPGSLGLPYVGETVALFSDPLGYVAKRRARYGMAFKTQLLDGRPAVVLPGAPAQQLVLVSGGAHSPFVNSCLKVGSCALCVQRPVGRAVHRAMLGRPHP